MNRLTMLLSILVLAVFMIVAAPWANSQSHVTNTSLEASAKPHSVTLGYLTDLSGLMSDWGNDGSAGVQLAQAELAAEGITLKVIYGDHQLQTNKALSEAEKMLTRDDVDALIVEGAAPVAAVLPRVKRSGRLFLISSPIISPLKEYNYAFRTYLDYQNGCRLLAEYFTKNKLSVGHFKPVVEFGELCEAGIQEVLLDYPTQEFNYGDDVRSQVLSLKQRGIEAIINLSYEGDVHKMIAAAESIGYQPRYGILQDSIGPIITVHHNQTLPRLVSYGFKAVSKPLLTRLNKYRKGGPVILPQAAAMLYLSTLQLGRSLAACPNKDTACQAKTLASSPSAQVLGFKGYHDRIAMFDLIIKDYGQAPE